MEGLRPGSGPAERSSTAVPRPHVVAAGPPLQQASSGRRLFLRELQLSSDVHAGAAPHVHLAAGAKHAALSGPPPACALVVPIETPASALSELLLAEEIDDDPREGGDGEQQQRRGIRSAVAYELGWRLFSGAGGVQQHIPNAVHWLKVAASADHAGAKCAPALPPI